jgi:hypothetical protein
MFLQAKRLLELHGIVPFCHHAIPQHFIENCAMWYIARILLY